MQSKTSISLQRVSSKSRDLYFPLLLHRDLNVPASVSKKLWLVMQHLAAHGNTVKTKGCKGDNHGWLRSELEGKHYYLWWAPKSTRQTKGLVLPDRAIVVRAVRHHDDHTPLPVGTLSDYDSLSLQEFQTGGFLEPNLTESQKEFQNAGEPVQLLHGSPGSGKTIALWNAILQRGGKKILYLTWSRELASKTGEFFRTFAPSDVEITPQYFTQFLGALRGTDAARNSSSESYLRFAKAIGRLTDGVLGPWACRPRALYAEIRAHILGRAIPEAETCVYQGAIARLSDFAYIDLRGGSDGVGKQAAESLLRVMACDDLKDVLADIFPELAAAASAFTLLHENQASQTLPPFDGVVIDEVQDMTLLESAVIVRVCRGIQRKFGYAPWLLAAGDEGQTVRPSGFEWGRLKHLLASRLKPQPREFQLADNLRYHGIIADVVERATEHYSQLEKGRRPTKQRRANRGEDAKAHLFHVRAHSQAEAIKLMRLLQCKVGVGIISPEEETPSWVQKHVRVLTPDEAKGMEYEVVCILNPGQLLSRLGKMAHLPECAALEMHAQRTNIDRLRVALSRATETLVFLDVDATDADYKRSQELLGDSIVFSPDELCAHLSGADLLMDGPTPSCLIEAEYLIEDNPGKAWSAVLQGLEMLPEGGGIDTLFEVNRNEVRRALLAVASRLLVDGMPSGLVRSEIIEKANRSLLELGSPKESAGFECLVTWTANMSASPFDLLNAVTSLPASIQWLQEALNNKAQTLRKSIDKWASFKATAKLLAGPVDSWLKATNYAGNLGDETLRLRRKAYLVLIQSGNLEAAELIRQTEPGVLEQKKARVSDSAKKVVHLKPPFTVKVLATAMGIRPFQVIADLMEMNIFASINEAIKADLAATVCTKYGWHFEHD